MADNSFFKDIAGLKDEKLILELSKCGTIKTYSPNDFILHMGDIKNEVYVNIKGIVRGAILLENGDEVTDCFMFQPGEATLSSFATFAMNVPSPEDLIAVNKVQLLVFHMEDILNLMSQYKELREWALTAMSKACERHWQLQIIMKKSTAKMKYEWFLENYPGIIYQVSNRYIAGFLGMDPATLSKLKNEKYN